MRRIGVLTGGARTDPVVSLQSAALLQGLQQLGWIDGRNVQIDYRLAAGNADNTRKYSAELVALVPDVILAAGTSTSRSVAAGGWRGAGRICELRLIRSVQVMSKAWRGQAATPPGLPILSMA